MGRVIDLLRNTIDGKSHGPRICELALALSDGPVRTDDLIAKMYGVIEPRDARNSIKQIALCARRAGVPVHGVASNGGYYWLR